MSSLSRRLEIKRLGLTDGAPLRILARMKLPFKLKRFKRASAFAPELGPLERELMELLWSEEATDVSVRDIHLAFDERLAYTTLMTTLDRLYKKGLLDRRKEGRAFFYSPRFSSDEFERGVARDVIYTLLGRGADGVEPILACIIDAVSEHDRAMLDELDRLIQEKRRELGRKE
ncbi:MAG: BlaI/MecI/CopY family transcriptional regulator [Chloracidobacterium sp.]|nr:BlaI/MecI/CopY family transcriptional regulator [Chloracidobacterium sp.]